MRGSLCAGVALSLALLVTACSGDGGAAKASQDAAFAACIQEWSEGAAIFNGGKAEDYTEDPGVIETCEAFRDLDNAATDFPAYTPVPAAELDQECLREWAEKAMDPDGPFTGFEGKTVDEVMQDPMARFSCE